MKKTKKVLLASSMLSMVLAPVVACDKDEDVTQTQNKLTKGTCENGSFSLIKDEASNKIVVKATPNTGYEFDRAYYTFDNDSAIEYPIPETGFTQPEGEITVYVNFKQISNTNTISISSSLNNGTITISNSNYKANDEITIAVTPNAGYRLKKVYYTNSQNTQIDIVNNKFTWDGTNIELNAEFVSYYGTYLLDDVSGVEDEIKEFILATGKFSFVKIEEKLQLGYVNSDITTEYVTSQFNYTLNGNILSYQDEADLVSIALTDTGFTMTIPDIDAVLHYELTTPFAFEYNTRYTHTNHGDSSSYPLQEYEFKENGDIYMILSNGDLVEVINTKLGTYNLYGDMLIITEENGDKYVLKITLDNNTYSLDGIFIDVSNTTTNNAYPTSMKFEKSTNSINIEQTPNGLISINPNYKVNDTINVFTMMEKGYRLKRLYYVKSDGSETTISNNQFVWDGSNIELKAEFVNYYGSYVFDEIVGDEEASAHMKNGTAYSVFEIGDKVTIKSMGANNDYHQGEFDYTLVNNTITITGYPTTITLTDNGFTFVSESKTINYKLVENFNIKLNTKYLVTNNENEQLEFVFYEDGLFRQIETSKITGIERNNCIQGSYEIYGDIIIVKSFGYDEEIYVGKLSLEDDLYTLTGFVFYEDEEEYTKYPILWELKESSLVNFDYPVVLTETQNGSYNFFEHSDGTYGINDWANTGYQFKRAYYKNLDDTTDTTEYAIDNINDFTLPSFKIALYVEFEPITQE